MQALLQLDGNILLIIQDYLRFPWLTPIMKFITSLGNAGLIWILLTIFLLARKKTRKLGFTCAVSMLLVLVIDLAFLKPFIGRIRPYEVVDGLNLLVAKASDFSFPSGHSASSFAVAWVIFRLSDRRYGLPALILAILIAWSRLYVGIHYPTDVICGILSGILFAEIAMKAAPELYAKIDSGHSR